MTASDGSLRVSVELGLTLPIPGIDYSSVRPTTRIDNIDPNGDVEAQITLGLETAAKALVALDEHMEVAIHDMLAPETNAPGYRDRLTSVERTQAAVVERLNEVVRRMKQPEVAAALAAAVREKGGEANG